MFLSSVVRFISASVEDGTGDKQDKSCGETEYGVQCGYAEIFSYEIYGKAFKSNDTEHDKRRFEKGKPDVVIAVSRYGSCRCDGDLACVLVLRFCANAAHVSRGIQAYPVRLRAVAQVIVLVRRNGLGGVLRGLLIAVALRVSIIPVSVFVCVRIYGTGVEIADLFIQTVFPLD